MSADRDRRPASCREFVEDLTGHSTRRMATAVDTGSLNNDMWYLVYKDENGTLHTVKGSTSAIRRSLRDGILGDASNVRAARVKTGPFEPLRGFPEFRDIMVTPAAVSVAAAASTPGPLPVNTSEGPPTDVSGPTDTGAAGAPVSPSSRVKGMSRVSARVLLAKEAPKIELQEAPPPAPLETSFEWLKWVLLAVLALAGATAAYLLIPGR
jgi:hypothetical protein